MPRSIWKGAISFGLVTIPVKLFSATEEKDISFRQVHPVDGGRIKYKRVCELDGEEVPYSEIAKGYELPDGRMVILEAEDFDKLPLPTTKSVEVVQFVGADEVDPTYFAKTYFLEADGPGTKPYVLLRDALEASERCALVKVALRNKENLALIRPRDGVLLMHTMLWPDELRNGSFAAPPAEVTVSPAEITMAQSFIDALAGNFDPTAYSDAYREALESVVESKLNGTELVDEGAEPAHEAEVVDLVAALRASVEAAKKRREQESGGARSSAAAAPRKGSAATKKSAAKKSAAKKAASKSAAADESTDRESAGSESAGRESAASERRRAKKAS